MRFQRRSIAIYRGENVFKELHVSFILFYFFLFHKRPFETMLGHTIQSNAFWKRDLHCHENNLRCSFFTSRFRTPLNKYSLHEVLSRSSKMDRNKIHTYSPCHWKAPSLVREEITPLALSPVIPSIIFPVFQRLPL